VASWSSDADYLAALRAANMDTAHGEADVRTRQARLRRDLGTMLPEVRRAGTFERKDISTGWESRGLFRTGMRQDDIARQRYDEERRVADATTSVGDQVGDLETQLARLRADANRRRTDAAYGAQTREYARGQEEALRREGFDREDSLAAEMRAMQEALYKQVYGRAATPVADRSPTWGMNPPRRYGVNV
jgi:hypothetical protein